MGFSIGFSMGFAQARSVSSASHVRQHTSPHSFGNMLRALNQGTRALNQRVRALNQISPGASAAACVPPICASHGPYESRSTLPRVMSVCRPWLALLRRSLASLPPILHGCVLAQVRLVADFPHATAARKLFLCLSLQPAAPPVAHSQPQPLAELANGRARASEASDGAIRCPLAWPFRCGCAAAWWGDNPSARIGTNAWNCGSAMSTGVGGGRAAAEERLRLEHRRHARRLLRCLRRGAALTAPLALPQPAGSQPEPRHPAQQQTALQEPAEHEPLQQQEMLRRLLQRQRRGCDLLRAAAVAPSGPGPEAAAAAAALAAGLRAAGWEVEARQAASPPPAAAAGCALSAVRASSHCAAISPPEQAAGANSAKPRGKRSRAERRRDREAAAQQPMWPVDDVVLQLVVPDAQCMGGVVRVGTLRAAGMQPHTAVGVALAAGVAGGGVAALRLCETMRGAGLQTICFDVVLGAEEGSGVDMVWVLMLPDLLGGDSGYDAAAVTEVQRTLVASIAGLGPN